MSLSKLIAYPVVTMAGCLAQAWNLHKGKG
jgi:hypothetical protein